MALLWKTPVGSVTKHARVFTMMHVVGVVQHFFSFGDSILSTHEFRARTKNPTPTGGSEGSIAPLFTFKAVDDVLPYAASVEGRLLAHDGNVPVQPVVVVLVHRKPVQHHLQTARSGATQTRKKKNTKKYEKGQNARVATPHIHTFTRNKYSRMTGSAKASFERRPTTHDCTELRKKNGWLTNRRDSRQQQRCNHIYQTTGPAKKRRGELQRTNPQLCAGAPGRLRAMDFSLLYTSPAERQQRRGICRVWFPFPRPLLSPRLLNIFFDKRQRQTHVSSRMRMISFLLL